MTAATKTGARAKPLKAPARPAKPKATKTPQAKPATPLEVTAPIGRTITLTPGRRWAAWLAAVGNDAAIEWVEGAIAEGATLQPLCATHMVPYTTVRAWIAADEGRAAKYAQAREDRADKLADEIVAIADEVEVAARYDGEDVKLAVDAAAIARNRLRVDARKWVAAKLKPRTYADKTTTELTGAGGGAIEHSLAVRFVGAEGSAEQAGVSGAIGIKFTKAQG